MNSTYVGDNQFGRPQFDTTRSEPGEALFRLKYRNDFSQVEPLARAMYDHIIPRVGKFSIAVPTPASNHRARQPVHEIAQKLAEISGTLYAELLTKSPAPPGTPQIKDLPTKEQKVAALSERFSLNEKIITNQGKWDVLLVDDRYDSGASLEAACAVLQSYAKIGSVFVATCTW